MDTAGIIMFRDSELLNMDKQIPTYFSVKYVVKKTWKLMRSFFVAI